MKEKVKVYSGSRKIHYVKNYIILKIILNKKMTN